MDRQLAERKALKKTSPELSEGYGQGYPDHRKRESEDYSPILYTHVPTRINSPLYFADLDRCVPASRLVRCARPSCWRTIDYRTEDFNGVMLKAGPETAAAEVTYPLDVTGWYDIYIGLFNTAWSPYRDQRVWIKLSGDAAYSLLYLPAPGSEKQRIIQEVFWKTADLTGQRMSFKQFCTESGGSSRRSNCDEVWVAYFKIVPLAEREIAALLEDRKRTDSKRLFATQDWGTGMVADATAGSIRGLLEGYRDTDFARIYWEFAVGDLCGYFTEVGRKWSDVQLQDFPSPGYRRIVENWNEYQRQDTDPLLIALDHAHDVGLEFHASYRFCEGMGPFHFSPPFDEANRGGFYEAHPELRAVRRDGSRAPRISLSFSETRRFLLDLFLEAAGYPVDGIALLYNRRPPFVEFEPPLVDGFMAKFGVDPRALDDNDERWLRYRASVLTEFMRELRQELDRLARAVGRPLPHSVSAWVFGSEKENLFYGLDVDTWIQEELLDTVIPYTSSQNLSSWEMAWEKDEDVEYWLSVTRGTRCKLALNLMPRTLSSEQYRRKAHALYRRGVTCLAFWDSAKIWTLIDQSRQRGTGESFWELRRLGHSEEVASWDGAGEPPLEPSAVRVLSLGDGEMTFIAE